MSIGFFVGGLAATALMISFICVKLLQSDYPIKKTPSTPSLQPDPNSSALTHTTKFSRVSRRDKKPTDTKNDQLLKRMYAFYNETKGSIPTGNRTEDSSRTLTNILNWSDDQLEVTHDYIQWLFATERPSDHNSYSPIFTSKEAVQKVRNDPTIQDNYRRAFTRIMEFYGFYYDKGTLSLRDLSNAQKRIGEWTTPHSGIDNHNFLRLSRILKSLEIYNLQDERTALWIKLQEIKNGNYDLLPTQQELLVGQKTTLYSKRIERAYPAWEQAANYKWEKQD